MKLHKKIFVNATLELLTGLHIGDSSDNVEIGGVDSPVVRRKDNNQPYIPGSSLKGKIRSLLEITTGSNGNGKFETKDYQGKGVLIPELFGSKDKPSKILVRDAYLTDESEKQLSESPYTEMPYLEIKFENVINRIKGTAEHPRQIERVPAGAKFNVEFVINLKSDNEAEDWAKMESEYVALLKQGIALLEDDYLGGSGTRGYGRVKLSDFTLTEKSAESYLNEIV